MLERLFQTGVQDGAVSWQGVLLALATALVLGLVIGGFYMLVSAQTGSFAIVLAVLPVLVAAIILVVNGNIGTSVAVLGAFGLIRFRSAPGSGQEIVFIFFAMAVGLAAGMGVFWLAAVLTVVVGLEVLCLEKLNFGKGVPRDRELRITIPEDLNYPGLFDGVLARYTSRATLERVRTTNMGTLYELSYRVRLRDPGQEKELIDALRCRNGNLTVSLGLLRTDRNEL